MAGEGLHLLPRPLSVGVGFIIKNRQPQGSLNSALSLPGTSPSWTIPSLTFPPWLLPLMGNSPHGTSPPTFFRFVARFTCVRIGDSSRNRVASNCIFHAKPDNVVSMYTFHGELPVR